MTCAPGRSPGPLRDPLDRMLIAEAIGRELAFVSNETFFDRYREIRSWRGRYRLEAEADIT